jgi:tripartite-type tricarboxylate transporter receptor subunit TctC
MSAALRFISWRCAIGLVAGLVAFATPAVAENYPSRPVRIIVGQAAGSTADIAARLMGQWLSERLGQQFIIDNRPGAGQNIGAEAAIHSAPDGYTLLLSTTANATNTTLYDNLSFNFIRDTTPVGGVLWSPNVMEVNPAIPAKTVFDFIAYAKANPGKISFASGGIGTTPHLAGELFMMMTGVKMLHVSYRGTTPALADLIGGQVQVMFDALPPSIGYIKQGTLRALAITSATSSPSLPDLPTLGSSVPGYAVMSWAALVAPAQTPADIVTTLNKEINEGLADPALDDKLARLGALPMVMTPAELGKLIADDTAKWAKVIKSAGIKAE